MRVGEINNLNSEVCDKSVGVKDVSVDTEESTLKDASTRKLCAFCFIVYTVCWV